MRKRDDALDRGRAFDSVDTTAKDYDRAQPAAAFAGP
jgi:hypothetical protein